MVKNSFFLICVVFGAIILNGCNGSSTIDDFELDFGYDYFPLKIGKFQTYVVDSTLYDIGDNEEIIVTNSQTFVMHLVADTISDNLGRSGFKIERYERLNDTLDWELKDIWSAYRSEEGAEWIEENLRFLKMVFPVKEGVDWDGNRFIDATTIIPIAGESVEVFKSWYYETLSVGQSELIEDMAFDDVTTISQADSENLIELRQSTEKYARGVGLIYREMKILDTQCIIECENMSWEEKAEKGFILKQQIIDYN